MEEQNKLIVFESQEIRRVWHNEEWWFGIVDIVAALTESKNLSGYIKYMRRRDKELSKGSSNLSLNLDIEITSSDQLL